MDAQVPAVVAVVVTADPGPWFDEALSSLAAQDYGELSVLVLSSGADTAAVTERVGRILPDAFVRHLPGRPGYAAASNEVLGMVEGAAFFLLCHDDVALGPRRGPQTGRGVVPLQCRRGVPEVRQLGRSRDPPACRDEL